MFRCSFLCIAFLFLFLVSHEIGNFNLVAHTNQQFNMTQCQDKSRLICSHTAKSAQNETLRPNNALAKLNLYVFIIVDIA